MERSNAGEAEVRELCGKTILIVEDDEFIFSLIEMMLRGTGIDILYAGNGEAALRMMNEKAVDLVLMDIRLPGQNGFEVFERIREQKNHIPVVAHTANCIPEEKERFLAAGFAGYLEKPIDSCTIQQLLRELIGNN